MLCSLNQIIEYNHDAVIKRFQKDFPEKAHRAETIFEDLMRFFWGTKKHEEDRLASPRNSQFHFFFIMDQDMGEIDQMWHVFLLYTRDYMDFCNRYFGTYLHHQPDLVPLFEKEGFQFEGNLKKFLDYSYDLLGEEVIHRWFALSLQEAV